MLSDHSKQRDKYRLPVLERRRKAIVWNAEHKKLGLLIEGVRDPIEDIV